MAVTFVEKQVDIIGLLFYHLSKNQKYKAKTVFKTP